MTAPVCTYTGLTTTKICNGKQSHTPINTNFVVCAGRSRLYLQHNLSTRAKISQLVANLITSRQQAVFALSVASPAASMQQAVTIRTTNFSFLKQFKGINLMLYKNIHAKLTEAIVEPMTSTGCLRTPSPFLYARILNCRFRLRRLNLFI